MKNTTARILHALLLVLFSLHPLHLHAMHKGAAAAPQAPVQTMTASREFKAALLAIQKNVGQSVRAGTLNLNIHNEILANKMFTKLMERAKSAPTKTLVLAKTDVEAAQELRNIAITGDVTSFNGSVTGLSDKTIARRIALSLSKDGTRLDDKQGIPAYIIAASYYHPDLLKKFIPYFLDAPVQRGKALAAAALKPEEDPSKQAAQKATIQLLLKTKDETKMHALIRPILDNATDALKHLNPSRMAIITDIYNEILNPQAKSALTPQPQASTTTTMPTPSAQASMITTGSPTPSLSPESMQSINEIKKISEDFPTYASVDDIVHYLFIARFNSLLEKLPPAQQQKIRADLATKPPFDVMLSIPDLDDDMIAIIYEIAAAASSGLKKASQPKAQPKIKTQPKFEAPTYQNVQDAIYACNQYLANPRGAEAGTLPIDVVTMIAKIKDARQRVSLFANLIATIGAYESMQSFKEIPMYVLTDKARLQKELDRLVAENYPDQAKK